MSEAAWETVRSFYFAEIRERVFEYVTGNRGRPPCVDAGLLANDS